ncbi:hypothetical protein BB050_03491 [Flavobacterium anhuiense]|uniref:Uncharacterized protein n=1 Tax=Flavobacterium anhuiense TaxID=459526 RepID=A0AAC9GJF2_9FLAO|nr:hypothetical protein [Flavobacterium anhuiense]AOC96580.1 hypothetical protein BB050_03491 [Flavobacterium anhuiense]
MIRIILFIFMFLSSIVRCISQESQFYSSSKKEKLSTEAYEVFRANKFLNFKDKDSLIENIEGSVYKKTNLNTFFQHKKDWEKIQKEDTASYAKKDNAKYAYKNNTMIETYLEFGSYNVRKEIKKVYNPKSFVLLHEKKYFVGENYNRTESIVNEYDNQNRVIKIIKRTEYSKKENNEESIITSKYENNTVTISSKNGTIACELISNKNLLEKESLLALPFDYYKYIEECYLEENAKCNEKYPRVKGNELKSITNIIHSKINKNNPNVVYKIDNGGLPFQTYLVNIRDEKEDYFLDHLILNVKDQELISKQLIAIEADGEVPEDANYTAKSFVINKDLTIGIFEMRFSKIYKKLNEGYKITPEGKIISSKTRSENRREANSWSGKYTFKRTNKDELVTSFSIDIKSLDDIAIVYIGDGEKPELYKNLKAENIAEDKIKIVFNKKYNELGIIYIQKNDKQYIISGESIANINPGNDEYPLKKIN